MNAEKLIQLYHRLEFDRRELLTELSPVSDAQAFDRWCHTVRPFTQAEIVNQEWAKTCAMGYITQLQFLADGRVDEYTLYDQIHVAGQWQLVDGMLDVTLHTQLHTYTFTVIASQGSSIHHAIELEDGEWHSLLKIMQLKPCA